MIVVRTGLAAKQPMTLAAADLANFTAFTAHCSYAAQGLPLTGNHGPIRVMTDGHPVLLRLAAH